MLKNFGARLRQRREEQAIDLIAIAEQTKIKRSLLEALERDDVSQWPSGIFRRAFIRAYAHAIGLDPDVVVREFLEVYPEPGEALEIASAVVSGGNGGGPPTRLRNLVGSAIGSLSRLRRSPAVDDLVVAECATVNVRVPSAPHRPAATPVSTESGRVERANEIVAVRAPVNQPVSSESDLHAVAYPPTEPGRADKANDLVAGRTPANEAASSEPDFLAAAHLCTELGRVEHTNEVQPLLQEAARILGAIGLIVWVWDEVAAELSPALAHGYSDRVLAQLPTVRRDADNATAAAFRSAQTCAIKGSAQASGALVVPLLTPAGCAGVLAFELPHGSEQARSVHAVATMFAAQLAQWLGGARPGEVQRHAELSVPTPGHFTTPIFHANVRR